MQITRLRMVVEECERDLIDEGATHITGYYQHGGVWWDLSTAAQADAAISLELNQCLTSKSPYRSKNSKYANFSLVEVQAVVRAKFSAPVRKATLAAIQRIVIRGYRNASNAFAVKYNPTTGLLAKSAFNQLVAERLNALGTIEGPSTEFRATESSPPALCLLTIDIDHFKQVNDSYGHAYGDLVLKVFAMRFESAAADFCKNKTTKIEATCAHVSGEEFFCIAWGGADTLEFEALAESILEAVRDSALPSDTEIERIRLNSPDMDINIPPARSRRITCSIGGVIYGVPASQDSKTSAEKLINQADVALSKSKNQGRDRATFFSTILHSGGRVIEYRSDVRICILDVGADVGVAKGQEFVVYHPEFTGKHNFIRDDGRSRKVLGKLPRVPLCTITVFDTQRDVSFCRISDDRFLDTPIPPNAALEAIPLGTLSTGTSSGTVWWADESIASVASITETLQRLSGQIGPTDEASIVVVGLRNESQLLSEHGTAAVNRALVSACRCLQKMTEVGFIGQIETTRLLLQLKKFGVSQQTELELALDQSDKEIGGRAKFVAGVYARNYGRAKDDPELPAIGNLKVRSDLARYAASPEGMFKETRIHVFSHRSARRILAGLLKARQFERALADYERFLEIGISDAALDNLAGLCAYSAGNMQRAETLFIKGAEKAPRHDSYRMNALISQLRQGNLSAAAQSADRLDLNTLEKGYRAYPFGTASFAIAIAERAIAADRPNPASTEIKWINRSLELDLSKNQRSRLTALLATLLEKQRCEPRPASPIGPGET